MKGGDFSPVRRSSGPTFREARNEAGDGRSTDANFALRPKTSGVGDGGGGYGPTASSGSPPSGVGDGGGAYGPTESSSKAPAGISKGGYSPSGTGNGGGGYGGSQG